VGKGRRLVALVGYVWGVSKELGWVWEGREVSRVGGMGMRGVSGMSCCRRRRRGRRRRRHRSKYNSWVRTLLDARLARPVLLLLRLRLCRLARAGRVRLLRQRP